jgi:hypothetical protein
VIVYFGQFYENNRSSPHFWELLFDTVKVTHSFWQNNALGKILAIFFTNSSGHPVGMKNFSGANL